MQYPLRALEEAGFLIRTEDALRSRRPLYSLADPIVRFHHVVTRHDLARFEDRRTDQAWSDAQPRFATHVLGPHFEQLAREFTARFASASTVGGQVASVGPAVISDPKARRQHEADVVALARRNDGSRSVLAIGEAKHTTAKRTTSDLLRLVHLRTLIASRDPAAATARLLLFSASGFERNLVNHVRHRSDVELINLARLYTGQ